MVKTEFQFPSFQQMHATEKRALKRLRQSIRYYFRTMRYRREISGFIGFLRQNPLWQPIFSQNSYRFNSLLSTYCDQRFSGQQRMSAMIDNFALAEDMWSIPLAQQLIEQKKLLLVKLTEDYCIYLKINDIDPFEGFFAVSLENGSDARVYDASFTFLSPKSLLITSIQGPNSEDAQHIVREATKALFGMRPMFMLVNIFKLFAQQFGCELLGIAHKNQAKYRWNDSSRLLFNYDEFWQENGAILNSQGYWQLPHEIERKSLEDIQSKKRSMYRKRYEMFDQTEQAIQLFFNKE